MLDYLGGKMKTPEEMAEEWIETRGWNEEPFRDEYEIEFRKEGYVAGYQTAKEHAHAALEEAEAKHEAYVLAAEENFKEMEAKIDSLQAKLSDAGILTTEHIVGASKMVSSSETLNNSSNNSNGWISVKDRLPDDGKEVLGIVYNDIRLGWIDLITTDPGQFHWVSSGIYIDKGHYALTHWMPLPEPPKEER
jgi:hypothetical protein